MIHYLNPNTKKTDFEELEEIARIATKDGKVTNPNVEISYAEIEEARGKLEKLEEATKWYVDTYALIAIHIIHKTKNFPSLVYATFEQVDNNVENNIAMVNTVTQEGKGKGDKDGELIFPIERDFPIPDEVKAINASFQELLKIEGNSVFQHYMLTGVQAHPLDYQDLNKGDEAVYHLANLVVETDEELQNFRGRAIDSTGTEKDPKTGELQVFRKEEDVHLANMVIANKDRAQLGRSINMGGCMGCHGVAQQKGGDFSFLIVGAPFKAPEFVGISEIDEKEKKKLPLYPRKK